jgi:uncharacterized protein (DUF362 family)
VELPVPGKALAHNNPGGLYTVPKIIQQCDRVITVTPLQTDIEDGVSLTLKNYLGIAPGAKYGFPKDGLRKLGSVDEVIVDLFRYHPADFAIAGGCWGVEGDSPNGAGVHHNVVVAGFKAGCVDAVAATLMGFQPKDLPLLGLADKNGFGIRDVDSIWTRGNSAEEATRSFRRPSAWRTTADAPKGPA